MRAARNRHRRLVPCGLRLAESEEHALELLGDMVIEVWCRKHRRWEPIMQREVLFR